MTIDYYCIFSFSVSWVDFGFMWRAFCTSSRTFFPVSWIVVASSKSSFMLCFFASVRAATTVIGSPPAMACASSSILVRPRSA